MTAVPAELVQASFTPATALPVTLFAGSLGALLAFFMPLGAGIPLGVLLARDSGLGIPGAVALYTVAYTFRILKIETIFFLFRWLQSRVPQLQRATELVNRASVRSGLRGGGLRGSMLTLTIAYAISPTAGRAAAALAGFGFIRAWALTIAGDMAYFLTLMASTLWLSDTFVNDHLALAVTLPAAILVPTFGRKLLLGSRETPEPRVAAAERRALPRRVARVARPALVVTGLVLTFGVLGARA